MTYTTAESGGVTIVRVGDARVSYPMLNEFSGTLSGLVAAGHRRIVLDLAPVTYVDSATIGCLMDLYRQLSAAGGALKLSSVQKRVETLLTMTGAQHFLQIHPDEQSAIASFGS